MLWFAASKEPTRFRPMIKFSPRETKDTSSQIRHRREQWPRNDRGESEMKECVLTDDGPVPRARDPQHLDLDRPPTMHAQRRQPHAIERIRRRTALTASLALATFAATVAIAEVERRSIHDTERNVAGAIESRIERPGAARDGEVSRRVESRREYGHPGRQLVRVVPDQEAVWWEEAEEGVRFCFCAAAATRRIEGAHEEMRLGLGRIVRPGRARA